MTGEALSQMPFANMAGDVFVVECEHEEPTVLQWKKAIVRHLAENVMRRVNDGEVEIPPGAVELMENLPRTTNGAVGWGERGLGTLGGCDNCS